MKPNRSKSYNDLVASIADRIEFLETLPTSNLKTRSGVIKLTKDGHIATIIHKEFTLDNDLDFSCFAE